jgi:monoamine oxidase
MSRKTGIPAAELRGLLAADRDVMPRRKFLQATAATAALPLLSRCASSGSGKNGGGGGGGSDDPVVVIVGGGIAGLHCAVRLAEAGVTATIYDSSSRLGGRMYTDRATFPDGMHCELGGELIDTDHETMRDLAQDLGLPLLDYNEDAPELSRLTAYFGGTHLTEEEVLTGFAPIAASIDEALLAITDQEDLYVYFDKPNGGEALDQLSITAWLDSVGATGTVRDLLEVAYTIEFGLEADVQSCLNMLFLISTGTDAFEEFGDSDERFHVAEGNDSIPAALADQLDPAQIELGAALVAIKAQGERYVLTFERDASTFDVTADHVVLALPFTRLRNVQLDVPLRDEKKNAIATLGYGTNTKIMCGFSDRVWRTGPQASQGSSYSDLGYQASWETSRLQPGSSGILTWYSGGDVGLAAGDGTPEDQMAAFLDQIDVVFPGTKAASNGKVARFHWPSHPHTLGSYACYKVGQYTTITGVEGLREGNLHFAGEQSNLDYQGYMEGAALSGAIAADEVLTDLGKIQSGLLLHPSAYAHPADRILARARATRRHRRWKYARALLAQGHAGR